MTRPHAALVRTYVPAIVGAGASVLIARSLPFSPFFLVPIGIVAITRGGVPLTIAVVLTVVFNFVTVFVMASPLSDIAIWGLFSDSAYFFVLVASFSWASFQGDGQHGKLFLRKSLRFVIASVVSAVVLFPIIVVARRDQTLVDFYNVQAVMIADAFKAGAGADVVEQSLIEREITAESVSRTISLVVSRGAVIGHLIFFGFSWRIAHMVASLRLPELRTRYVFVFFRNEPFLVWGLIVSLLSVLATKVIENSLFEVVSWNCMLLCVLLYLIQGMAVISYNLARPGVPKFLRSLLVVVGALVVFRPGINATVGIALALLGVAENWLPLRAPINTEPPSTPEA